MSHSYRSNFSISLFDAANKLNDENEIIIVIRINFLIMTSIVYVQDFPATDTIACGFFV